MAKGPNGPTEHPMFDRDPEYFTQFQERFDREQFYGLGYCGGSNGAASVYDDFPPKAEVVRSGDPFPMSNKPVVIERDEYVPTIFRHVEDRDKREKD